MWVQTFPCVKRHESCERARLAHVNGWIELLFWGCSAITQLQCETTGEGPLMLRYLHRIRQFFTDCLEALLDDEESFKRQQREAAARQKRWLEYLSRP